MLIKTDIKVNDCTVWLETDESHPNAMYTVGIVKELVAGAIKMQTRYSWRKATKDGDAPR